MIFESVTKFEIELKKLPVRQVLKLYRSFWLDTPHYDYYGVCEETEEQREERNQLLEMYKRVLATMGHVPNKVEARIIRKKKIVNQKNNKNKRYVNRRA